MSMKQLWKSTIIIWSPLDPAEIELSHLAREAESGDAYCAASKSVLVTEPGKDPDWDGTDFFYCPSDDEDEEDINK